MKKINHCKDCGKEILSCNIRCRDCYNVNQIIKVDIQKVYFLYFNKKLSIQKISKILHVSHGALGNLFQRQNWKTRKAKDYTSKYIDKTVLFDLYINQKLSSLKIANKLKCTKSLILKRLKVFDIPIRDISTSLKLADIKGINNPNYKGGLPKCLNCGKQLTHKESTRCLKCLCRFRVGKKHPNWKGGISKLPYSLDFTQKLKDEIRKRDNFTCQNCACKEEDHYQGNRKTNLTCHHINYNKQDCCKENLIALCDLCNKKANYNRDYWFAFYTYIIDNKLYKEKKYGIKYIC